MNETDIGHPFFQIDVVARVFEILLEELSEAEECNIGCGNPPQTEKYNINKWAKCLKDQSSNDTIPTIRN